MTKAPAPLASGVTIYGRTGCPYCDKAKVLVKKHKMKHIYVDNEAVMGYETLIRPLIGDYNFVPVVFVNGVFVGGYTELEQWVNKRPSAKRRPTKRLCVAYTQANRRCSRRSAKRCCAQHSKLGMC